VTELRAISMNVMGIDVRPRTTLALGSHRRRWERLFDALADSGADVIGVQELFWAGQRARFEARMSRAGYRVACGPTSLRRPGGLGLAVRGRILERRHHDFRLRRNLRSRWVRYGVLGVRAEVGDRRLDLAVTHLEAGSAESGRSRQAVELADWLESWSSDGSPAVLFGDLNASPQSEVVSRLRSGWDDCCGEGFGPTWGRNRLAGPSATPVRLDYVLVRSGAGPAPLAARRVLDDPEDPLSDHCGVEVTFRLAHRGGRG
jgi:endonuclease/exonuclease/phosphatase family metal-dependent hydrolase